MALEVHGFITRLCKMLCRSHDDQRAGSFLKQRISMALQIGNAACVLGTVSDRNAFEEIYYIQPIFLNLYIIAALKKFYRSTGKVAGMRSLLVDFFVTGIVLLWCSLFSLQTTGVCLLLPT